MRQLILQVAAGEGIEAMRLAEDGGAVNVATMSGHGSDGEGRDLVLATVANSEVGPLLEALEARGELRASFASAGALSVAPPVDRPPQALLDVTPRSPIEVVLAGMQSAGSWQAFLGYATIAGLVVWIGLYTSTVYLLTASMLLAPFAGPAMNTAIGAAAGDLGLVRHGVKRYLGGVLTTAAAAAALTLVVGQQLPTTLLVDVLSLHPVTVILPLAAGAAGALHLVQSEHSSLVSGAAVGMLVAASLAPPAGGLGMAAVLGRGDLVIRAVFVVVLQLVGITLVASALFRYFGVKPGGHRFGEGSTRALSAILAATLAVSAGLVALQLSTGTFLEHTGLARAAAATVAEVVDDPGGVSGLRLLDVQAQLAPLSEASPPRLILTATVEAAEGAETDSEMIADRFTEVLRRRYPDVVPLVDVTLLRGP